MGFPFWRQLLGNAVTLLRVRSAEIQMSQNQHSNSPAPSSPALQNPAASFALLSIEVDGEPLHGAHQVKMNHF